jgi:hypothetical protein
MKVIADVAVELQQQLLLFLLSVEIPFWLSLF